ncbi:MAG: proliferating cell nuclear antigen (pcna) [Candidatus Bathyarchaeia archaeon]|nr:proliferating cell nuclear antigen (pcna) [Candidatus Bathyarchaeota archaeon]
MFKAVISDAKLFRNLMSAVSTLVEEANFDLDPGGLKVRAMDPSHVAMVDLDLPKDAFQEYECSQYATVRLSLDGLIRLLKRAKPNETIEITYNVETRKIELTVKDEVKKEFRISTLEAVEEKAPTPKIAFRAKVKMASTSLKEIIEDAQAIGDSVAFEATPEKFTVLVEGELNAARFELDNDSPAVIEFAVDEPSKASFNLTYLADMVRAGASSSEILSLEFSTNMPLKLEFPLPQSGALSYYLAPRIEAE